jgi:hypothetical protein
MPGATCLLKVVAGVRHASVPSGQGTAICSAADLLGSSSDFIDIDIFVNCSWVGTRW